MEICKAKATYDPSGEPFGPVEKLILSEDISNTERKEVNDNIDFEI